MLPEEIAARHLELQGGPACSAAASRSSSVDVLQCNLRLSYSLVGGIDVLQRAMQLEYGLDYE